MTDPQSDSNSQSKKDLSTASGAPRVAVLVDTATGWGRRLIQGVFQYGHRHGRWHLDVRARYPQGEVRIPEGWTGDGIIARLATPEIVEHVKSFGVPYVNVSSIASDKRAPMITSDKRAIAEIATQHFLERGFSHFAYSGEDDLPYVKAQREDFEAEVRKHGFEVITDPDPVSHDPAANYAELMQHLVEWVKALPKPCAVFSFGTQRGVDLLEACRMADVVVPHEVAVLGGDYDDVLCEACDPPMSAVVTASQRIGYEAAEVLSRMMQGEEVEARKTVLAPVNIHSNPSTNTYAVKDKNLITAMQFIERNAFEPIQMEDVLEQVPMSRRTLERHFKDAFGKTPAEEIRWRRVHQARKLLAETNMDLEDVAKASGLNSYAYLSQVFRKMLDETPAGYRKRMRDV
ncbi:AraC family transcriptional regulator [Algisphaera agarilytica]|uniref:LacI family transcriptional regulator n=1 Tax=Algisphaera agarilytica TaxID=1385975 RepID=A0A7X0H7I0_9BACT|nr:DNA-binding transcriptional regulator [Algisphaera agarilytica]MBB6429235.1 LacI family transcriptional regulator [Algisphaera agarilytica]